MTRFPLLLLALPLLIRADIIPDYREVAWTNSGVPGGIPTRTTVYTNIPAGTAGDDIRTALGNCPKGQVVVLLAGTHNAFTIGDSPDRTLRGVGATTIIPRITSEQYTLQASGETLSSGYTQGSTSIVFSATPGANVYAPNTMEIRASDNTNFVFHSGGPGTRVGTMVRILTVSGTTVTFEPPLPWNYTGMTPKAHPVVAPFALGLTNFGIEDLTINSDADTFQVSMFGTYGCWFKGVTFTNASDIGLYLSACLRTEVRACTFKQVKNFPAHTDGMGIVLDEATSFARIEDNIAEKLGTFVIYKNRLAANVVAFNFATNFQRASATRQLDRAVQAHGGHNMMFLLEGNAIPHISSDGVHGSESHQTTLRNWFHGIDTYSDNQIVIDYCRGSYSNNVIGNIIGHPSWTNSALFTYSFVTADLGYSDTHAIYRFGWPNQGNNSLGDGEIGVNEWVNSYPWITYPMVTVSNSIILHGNYDYFTHSQIWDAGIADHAIPDSYLYSSKPSYFGNCPWPPFNPASPELASPLNIPAGRRFYGVSYNESASRIAIGARATVGRVTGQ